MARGILLLAALCASGCAGSDPETDPSSATTTASAATAGSGGDTTGPGASSTTSSAQGGSSASTGAGGTAGWGPDQCPTPPAGVEIGLEVGDQLPDIVVKDCDGNDYSLTELCGAQALWIFAAHGWCPLCQSVSSQAEEIQDEYAPLGLASVNVVVQDGQSNPPTEGYCKVWHDEHGHEDVKTLYDPTGAILALWGNSSSLSAFVGPDRVIVSKLEHESDRAVIEAGIEQALGD